MSYLRQIREARLEHRKVLGIEELKRLHRRRPWRHFAVAGRQYALLLACGYGLVRWSDPKVWLALALIQGFTVFGFTVLLHEVVHKAVFTRSRERATRWLSFLYAVPSGMSPAQFTRWHLDHHDGLGTETEDPKRAHLSPKRNRRWLKLLYFTPALFPIYFRAAAREAASYPEPLRRRIRGERRATVLFHVLAMAALWAGGGPAVLLRAYLVPVFFVFPLAFAINRMGQHYHVRPDDPEEWSTLVKSSWFWNFWFLNSTFHREHHYYPAVPMYNLPRLHRLLLPYYRERGIKAYGYGELFFCYILGNEAPHTDWERRAEAGGA